MTTSKYTKESKNTINEQEMRKITLDFNQPLVNLKGDKAEHTLGALLADLISTESKGNSVKLYGWALDLVKPVSLELDKSDAKTLEDLITGTDRIMVLVKAQLLAVFDSAKEVADKE